MRRVFMPIIMQNNWNDITKPVGWTWVLPFTIQKSSRNFRVRSDWTIDQNRPTGKAYYVSPTGSDSNDGAVIGA